MAVNWNTKIKPWGTFSSDTLFQMNLLYFKFIKTVEITSSTQFQVATKSTSSDLTTVFQAWPYGRFIQRERERYRATAGERNFIEWIKAPIFLEALLAVGTM